MSGQILPLPKNVRSRLRSGINLTSVTQCVDELVANSLDAGATCIMVRVDLDLFKIQVIDNGHGLDQDNFKYFGERHATSKCKSLADLNAHLTHYGFRGEALASIIEVSAAVEVTSRPHGTPLTFCKTFVHGREESLARVKTSRLSAGTSVTVRDFMHNMPVRRLLVREALDVERVRVRVESFALVHPEVSFTLRNDRNGAVIVRAPKSGGTLSTFTRLFGADRAQGLVGVGHASGPFTVGGYVSLRPYSTRALQFVYVNKRLVLRTRIHKLLNDLLASTSVVSGRLRTSGQGQRRGPSTPPKSTSLHGVFLINIECPHGEYDVCLDPSKTLVEFRDWDTLLRCIQELILKFVQQENLTFSSDERWNRGTGKNQETEEEEDADADSKPSVSQLEKFSLKRPTANVLGERYGLTICTEDNLLAVHSVPVKRGKKCHKATENVHDAKSCSKPISSAELESHGKAQGKCTSKDNGNEHSTVVSELDNKVIVLGGPAIQENPEMVPSTSANNDGSQSKICSSKYSSLDEFMDFYRADKLKTELTSHKTPEAAVKRTPSSPTPLKTTQSTSSHLEDLQLCVQPRPNVNSVKKSLSKALSSRWKKHKREAKMNKVLQKFEYQKKNQIHRYAGNISEKKKQHIDQNDKDFINKIHPANAVKGEVSEESEGRCHEDIVNVASNFKVEPSIWEEPELLDARDCLAAWKVNRGLRSSSDAHTPKQTVPACSKNVLDRGENFHTVEHRKRINDRAKEMREPPERDSECSENQRGSTPQTRVREKIGRECNEMEPNNANGDPIKGTSELATNNAIPESSYKLFEKRLDGRKLLKSHEDTDYCPEQLSMSSQSYSKGKDSIGNNELLASEVKINEPIRQKDESRKTDQLDSELNIATISTQLSDVENNITQNSQCERIREQNNLVLQESEGFSISGDSDISESTLSKTLEQSRDKKSCMEKATEICNKSQSVSSQVPTNCDVNSPNEDRAQSHRSHFPLESSKEKGQQLVPSLLYRKNEENISTSSKPPNPLSESLFSRSTSPDITAPQETAEKPSALNCGEDEIESTNLTMESFPLDFSEVMDKEKEPLTSRETVTHDKVICNGGEKNENRIGKESVDNDIHCPRDTLLPGMKNPYNLGENIETNMDSDVQNLSTTTDGLRKSIDKSKTIIAQKHIHGDMTQGAPNDSSIKPKDMHECNDREDHIGNRWKEVCDRNARKVFVDIETGNSQYDPPVFGETSGWKSSQPLGAPLHKTPFTHELGYEPELPARLKGKVITFRSKFAYSMHCEKVRNTAPEKNPTGISSDTPMGNEGNDEAGISPRKESRLVPKPSGSFMENLETDEQFKWSNKSSETKEGASKPSDVKEICQTCEAPNFAMDTDILNSEARATSRRGDQFWGGPPVRVYNSVYPYNFTREMLQSCEVIGQLEKKFIACSILYPLSNSPEHKHDKLVVLFEQHAAHERVRLESILLENVVTLSSGKPAIRSSSLTPPLVMEFPEDEVRMMMAFSEAFNQQGLHFTWVSSRSVSFQSIPSCLMSKTGKILNPKYHVADTVIHQTIREMCDSLQKSAATRGVLPRRLRHILNSQACTGAIKFGDDLTKMQCQELIRSLSSCQLPFQCAHGRPSIVPVVNITRLSTIRKKKNKLCLKKLRNAVQKTDSHCDA